MIDNSHIVLSQIYKYSVDELINFKNKIVTRVNTVWNR